MLPMKLVQLELPWTIPYAASGACRTHHGPGRARSRALNTVQQLLAHRRATPTASSSSGGAQPPGPADAPMRGPTDQGALREVSFAAAHRDALQPRGQAPPQELVRRPADLGFARAPVPGLVVQVQRQGLQPRREVR